MKYVRFLKDYWSFRKDEIVSVDTLTRGRARLIVARGFAEFTEGTKSKPKRKAKEEKPEPVVEEEKPEPEEEKQPWLMPEPERAVDSESEKRG